MDFVGLFLNKELPKPLYLQLYEFLAAEVRAGRIPAGEKLPGKRRAAAQLGVSVNTVGSRLARCLEKLRQKIEKDGITREYFSLDFSPRLRDSRCYSIRHKPKTQQASQ